MSTTSFSIPKTQRALVSHEYGGEIVLEKEWPVPEPGDDQILIRLLYSGVCHSDYDSWQNVYPAPTKLPLIAGHEGAGVVVAKGPLAKGFEIGDYAGLKFINATCGSCFYCERTFESSCIHATYSGYSVDGTFQQYVVANAFQAAKIPPGLDMAKVAPLLCAGVTVYRALKETNAKPGDWVAITGAGGGLGCLAVQYAHQMGFRVLAIDAGDVKGKTVKDLGAEKYIDFTKAKNIVSEVTKATGGPGPQAVLSIAVQEKAVSASIRYVRPRGTVVLVGLPPNGDIKTDIFSTVARAITIKGSYIGNRADTEEAIDLFARGLIDVPIQVVGMKELPRVFDLMHKGEICGRYVLDMNNYSTSNKL